jgi:hypothetical protein
MSLATVIRLEFAYPGVGVLAGDSLQYLSVATAHGVIMVFYMIMPAIFGAFGNFLLPTQLGVHDVAFPRLNSAAFWFLPGGLIMLCQLVCTDRRYARMNCFNIRELQGVLKRKFFTDLVNSHDHRSILDKSMLGLRYKSNADINLNLDITSFYNYGTHNQNLSKIFYLTSIHTERHKSIQGTDINKNTLMLHDYGFRFMNIINDGTADSRNFFNNLKFLKNFIIDMMGLGLSFTPYSFISFPSGYTALNIFYTNILLLSTPLSNATHYAINIFTFSPPLKPVPQLTITNEDNFNNMNLNNGFFTEQSGNQRFTRFSHLLINYDYKTGNYIGNWDKQYPYLINSFIEVARGIRKPVWFLSEDYTELLKTNIEKFNVTFTTQFNLKLSNVED